MCILDAVVAYLRSASDMRDFEFEKSMENSLPCCHKLVSSGMRFWDACDSLLSYME